MSTYMNCKDMCKLFGLSFDEMDTILIEHGLKSGELATQTAIDNDYVRLSFREDSRPFYHLNLLKISELTGRKLLDEIGFHFKDVMLYIQVAEQFGRDYAILLATHAYDEVPEALKNEVHKRVDREIIGDRRYACEKCGRMTLWNVKGFCWQCMPDDPFVRERHDCEVAVREAAAQLATVDWGTLYKDCNLKPMDTDIDLWNGAVDTAIDSFLTCLVNPSKCDGHLAKIIVDESYDGQVIAEFVYSGYEEYGWERCSAFLNLAYRTVGDVLTKVVT